MPIANLIPRQLPLPSLSLSLLSRSLLHPPTTLNSPSTRSPVPFEPVQRHIPLHIRRILISNPFLRGYFHRTFYNRDCWSEIRVCIFISNSGKYCIVCNFDILVLDWVKKKGKGKGSLERKRRSRYELFVSFVIYRGGKPVTFGWSLEDSKGREVWRWPEGISCAPSTVPWEVNQPTFLRRRGDSRSRGKFRFIELDMPLDRPLSILYLLLLLLRISRPVSMTKDDGLRDFEMAKYTYHVGNDLSGRGRKEEENR